MFKGYSVIEKTEEFIKLQCDKTGELHRRYKASCISCGADRGWKKAFQLKGKCKSCAQHDDFLNSIDKTTYPNVDLNDCIKYSKKTQGSEVRYKTTCPSCSSDRGYLPLAAATKHCRSCCRKSVHATKSLKEKQEIAQRISMTQTGHVEFSGFTTPVSDKQRDLFKSLGLSKQCFERDNYSCQKCLQIGGNLHAHHKNGFDKFPAQRFELANLVSLCKPCHDVFHTRYGKGNNTEKQYVEFQSFTHKKDLYVLTGAPASGKSWVVNQLKHLDVIDSDLIPKKDLVSRCNAASNPILTLTIGISTFIKNNPQFNVKLLVIIEDESVIVSRMLARKGRVTDTIKRRIKRMESLKKKALFSGTSAEVMLHLSKR